MGTCLVVIVVLVAGCRTTGGKIAAGIGVVGFGVEVAGVMKSVEGDAGTGTVMIYGGMLVAMYGAIASLMAESRFDGGGGGGGGTGGDGTAVGTPAGSAQGDGAATWDGNTGSAISSGVSESPPENASCRFGDCRDDGRTERRSDRSSSDVSCRFGDCGKSGWTERRSDGASSEVSCRFGDCGKDGWTRQGSDGTSSEISCHFGDCNKSGWTERRSDGTSLDCTCNFGDCNANGVSCH